MIGADLAAPLSLEEGTKWTPMPTTRIQLLAKLHLKDVVLVGHSAGDGEVAWYPGRHGSRRVVKALLVAAVTPLVLKTEVNPDGSPIEYYDGFRAALVKDRCTANA